MILLLLTRTSKKKPEFFNFLTFYVYSYPISSHLSLPYLIIHLPIIFRIIWFIPHSPGFDPLTCPLPLRCTANGSQQQAASTLGSSCCSYTTQASHSIMLCIMYWDSAMHSRTLFNPLQSSSVFNLFSIQLCLRYPLLNFFTYDSTTRNTPHYTTLHYTILHYITQPHPFHLIMCITSLSQAKR